MSWREEATRMFFDEGCGIGKIANETGVSRQSISAFLKGCPGFHEEKEKRKALNAVTRKEYKREKNREYRVLSASAVTAETIRREHDVAALILSREKYH